MLDKTRRNDVHARITTGSDTPDMERGHSYEEDTGDDK